jgi:hypothetical protein
LRVRVTVLEWVALRATVLGLASVNQTEIAHRALAYAATLLGTWASR